MNPLATIKTPWYREITLTRDATKKRAFLEIMTNGRTNRVCALLDTNHLTELRNAINDVLFQVSASSEGESTGPALHFETGHVEAGEPLTALAKAARDNDVFINVSFHAVDGESE